ncbi:MAG: AAA family ATPase [Candidatus Gracilibacteria bacterium]|nr:AAA family ATPase [Candidatus Gracilibacteria bacterium]
MKNSPNNLNNKAGNESSEQEKTFKKERVSSLMKFFRKKVLHEYSENEQLESELQAYYQGKTAVEKAADLYDNVMSHMAEKNGGNLDDEDQYLLSVIRVLMDDTDVKSVLEESFGQARIDKKYITNSALAHRLTALEKKLSESEAKKTKLDQKKNTTSFSGKDRGKKKRLEQKIKLLSAKIQSIRNERENLIATCQPIKSDTDVMSAFHYKTLQNYRDQLQEGFVWLPTRKKLKEKIVKALQGSRWPLLTGESGTGKSHLANSAALDMTGSLPLEIACEATTGEIDLIREVAISKSGESYQKYGALIKAFTGYDTSLQSEPSTNSGRIVRFDESGRMGTKAYSIIKTARQKKPGDDYYGKTVLPGASGIFTTNPVGPRYPDRKEFDTAVQREIASIEVDYPEMTQENPELYEFALACLMNEDGHIALGEDELSPAYTRSRIPEEEQQTFRDGGIGIEKDEIIPDATNKQHGALWRFSNAISALNECFNFGNTVKNNYPESLLRYQEVSGEIEINSNGNGEALTLSTSTISLGELSSWLTAYNSRREKDDADYQVDSLTKWLNIKIQSYIDQCKSEDKDKVRAIFKHFHFLNDKNDASQGSLPITPLQIGYLSPRVPRPMVVEYPEPVVEEHEETEAQDENQENTTLYETSDVMLDNESNSSIKILRTVGEGHALKYKQSFRRDEKSYTYAGIVSRPGHADDGKPVGKLMGTELYQVFDADVLEFAAIEQDLHMNDEKFLNTCRETYKYLCS